MYTFSKNPLISTIDNDLSVKRSLLIRILQIVASLAFFLAIIRFVNDNKIMLLVDIIFISVSLLGIYYLKKSLHNTYKITYIIITIFYLQVCMMFINPEYKILGPTWFIILIIFSFYQASLKVGVFISIISAISILILGNTVNDIYTLLEYIYIFVPLLVASLITYFYEMKVLNKENLLILQNSEQKKLLEEKEALLHQAHYDNLTKLPNRILFQDRLQQAIVKTNRSSKDFAILFIDLDEFKAINDSLGHAVGDSVLCEISTRLKETLREEDTIARFGGDEFLCIVEQLESCDAVSSLAQKLIDVTKHPIHMWGENISLTCSIGISIYKKDAKNEDMLLEHADIAMYKAKDLGKNNYQFYTPC